MAHGANGQRPKRRGPAGGVDLSAKALSDEQAQNVQEMLELQAGMRCGGCGRRIGMGTRFFSIDPRSSDPTQQRCACARDDCTYMEECRPHATCMEMVEFAWLDANGKDAPAARAIVELNERAAKAAAAESDSGSDTSAPADAAAD